MDIYDSLFSTSDTLNRQIGLELFKVIGEDGPVVAIVAPDGQWMASDADMFSNLDESYISDILTRFADGQDDLLDQHGKHTVYATDLYACDIHCGILMVLLSDCTLAEALLKMDCIETIASQTGLIAKLIEKNNRLHCRQLKMLSKGANICEFV